MIQYLVGTYVYNLMPIVLLIDQADFYIDVWSPWGHKKNKHGYQSSVRLNGLSEFSDQKLIL